MRDFKEFSKPINTQFDKMSSNEKLYRVDIEKDEIWNLYLKSFPEGTNPLHKERTVHDCNCCKNFIRDIGDVVSIDSDGNLISIWDAKGLSHEYEIVAKELSQLVKSKTIKDLFVHYQSNVGNEKTIQLVKDEKDKVVSTINWGSLLCKNSI